MASSVSAIGTINAAGSTGTSARQLPPPAPPQPRKASNDEVKLTLNAQIHLLQSEGQTATQISSSIPEPIATVNQYLEVTTAPLITTSSADSSADADLSSSSSGNTINVLT